MTLRCTRKLLKALQVPGAAVEAPATTVLGDWYAGLYDATPQPVILCISERSLLATMLVFTDAGEAIVAERAAMSEIAIGKTLNRRVLGCLNEAAFVLSTQLDCMHERYLGDHEMFLSSVMYSTTQYRWPHALTKELFQAAQSGSRPGLTGIH